MRIIETAQVLAKIQAFSNRNVDEAVITSWHEILEPYLLSDCLRAVTDHYRKTKEWIMPSDILYFVSEYAIERLRAFPQIVRIADRDEADDLKNGEWRDKNRRIHQMASRGEITRADYDAYHDGNIEFNQLGQKELTN